jgi:UDP:flavonoid glycosyltransferase YjiC (YdhE family)
LRTLRVLIVSWASGGNLPPLLAAGRLLAARDHRVCVLASAATRQPAVDAGFEVVGYRRAPDPEMDTAFEQQAAEMMATAAGPEIALDVRDVLAELRRELMIVDCMLPAGIASGESTGTPTVSLVHFPYGLARTLMLRGAGAWTTDRAQLNSTRSSLGLEPATDDLAAWESAELLLVTVPKWFDLATDYPAHVVHAGPLGVTRAPQEGGTPVVRLECLQRPAVSAQAIRVPPNIETVPYADHDHLLPRCAAVVTHGGLGTTLRALAHGTPLLLLPLGRDQQFNAGRVAEFGAGICLPVDASPGEIASALVELLAQPQFRKAAADAATAIATDRPDEAAVEALIGLARLAR